LRALVDSAACYRALSVSMNDSRQAMSNKLKPRLFALGMVVIFLVLVEGIFFAAGKVLQSKWGMWRVPAAVVSERHKLSFQQYLAQRDPVLGWPYPKEYGANLDATGAQHNPMFAPDGRRAPCVSLYGDSFTEGGDASSDDGKWGNLLSGRLNCYVANFGVGGYGTDQAFLRFSGNQNDRSPVVILGIHTENVMRNLTRLRDLQNYGRWYALKPRFVLNAQDELELVPKPTLSEAEYLRVIGAQRPLLKLPDEHFQPGGSAGVVALSFPYSVSVIRNMLKFEGFRSRLADRPDWMAYLQPGHPSNGLGISAAIAQQFVTLSKAQNRTPLLVILPHPMDFEYFEEKAVWPHHHLRQAYATRNLPFEDFGPYLLAHAKATGRESRKFFGPTMHYNDAGNALVARFVHERLVARSMIGGQQSAATPTAPRQ